MVCHNYGCMLIVIWMFYQFIFFKVLDNRNKKSMPVEFDWKTNAICLKLILLCTVYYLSRWLMSFIISDYTNYFDRPKMKLRIFLVKYPLKWINDYQRQGGSINKNIGYGVWYDSIKIMSKNVFMSLVLLIMAVKSLASWYVISLFFK